MCSIHIMLQHGSLVMSPLNITQPLGIWSTRWLLFLVMSNSPKNEHVPIPVTTCYNITVVANCCKWLLQIGYHVTESVLFNDHCPHQN